MKLTLVPWMTALCLLAWTAGGCSCSMTVGEEDGGSPNGDAGPAGPRTRAETCGNGIDDDGDARIDESCPCAPGEEQACWPGAHGTRGVGTCSDGVQRCAVAVAQEWGDWGDYPCEGAVEPVEEICDGMDHDCDGMRDESCPCTAGESRECGAAPIRNAPCRSGEQRCDESGTWSSDCEGRVEPSPEVCDDGIDNDCDGDVDPRALCDCAPVAEICDNGIDDDCDGAVDEPGGCAPDCVPVREVCGDGVDQDCDGSDLSCPDAGLDGGVDACTPRACRPADCGMVDLGCGVVSDCGPCSVTCSPTPRRVLGPTDLIVSSRGAPVVDGYAYLRTHSSGFIRVPLAGGPPQTISTQPADATVAADASNAFLGTAAGSHLGPASVLVVPPGGGSLPVSLFQSAAGTSHWPYQLEIAGSDIFTIATHASEAPAVGPGLLRISRLDGSFVRLVDADARNRTFRSDSTHFYWAEDGRATITFSRVARSGGPVQSLGSYAAEPGWPIAYMLGLGLDATHVYATTGPTGKVVRVLKTGGRVDVLHTSEGYTSGRLLMHGSDVVFNAEWHPDRPITDPGIYVMPSSGGAARRIVSLRPGEARTRFDIRTMQLIGDCMLYAHSDDGVGPSQRWELFLVEL